MSFNSAMLEQMKAEGLDLDACIRIVKAGEKKADPTNAERQARYREKRKRNGVTVTGVTPNDNKNTLTPGSEAKASKPFVWACPPNVDPQHWADFRKARKRKSCADSETAYLAVIRDLEKFSDDEWPPGRLVQRSAENGWAKIVNPREDKFGKSSHERPDPNPTISAVNRILGNC